MNVLTQRGGGGDEVEKEEEEGLGIWMNLTKKMKTESQIRRWNKFCFYSCSAANE